MIPRVGGKSKLKKVIVGMMPPHETYVEPFVGGGHVFMFKDPANNNVINDKDKDIANIWQDEKDVGEKMIGKDFTPTREKFERLLNQKSFSSKEERLYRNLYLSIGSFSGNRRTFVGEKELNTWKKGVEWGKKYKTTKWKDYLNENKVKILNQDFKAVIKKYDSPTTLFYLDPPYSKSTRDYKENSVTPQDVYNALQGIKGKFILSYDFSPEVKKVFEKYRKKIVTTAYEQSGQQQKGIKEYLIMNF